MARYVSDEQRWLDDYTSAWKVATTNGHEGLRYLDQTKEDPEPIIDECAALTKGKMCKQNKFCTWDRKAQKVENKRTGKVRFRGGCVPFERK
jgi:hypothetical protein